MDNASSSFKLPQKYDVLINFSGEDIRRKFVSHLDSVLSDVGFTTFLHEENEVKEMQIQEPILNMCRVAIVVFTKTYPQSAWCLHQLQQIIQWNQVYSRHVLPVYYEIQPSDVRLQRGDFGKAFKATAQQTFSAQQLEHGMSRWSHALTKAANFFGWDESNHRSDAELVDKIVKSLLNLPLLSATKFPVGLQSKVEDVIRTIKNKSTEVCRIGISGRGGSGKTTVAKAVYNQIHGTFMDKTFIEDIAQVTQTRGHVHLQQQLLLDVLKTKVEICSVEMGKRMIQERLSGRRVLLVLDDVPYFCEFLYLWDSCKWFGGGTVIIITMRDESIPSVGQLDSVFQINPLNPNQSLELLSWHAFREPKPKQEYNNLAESVATYCEGLPLALEVIGSCLFERTKEQWLSVLFELDKIPDRNVIQKLKISFDGLCNEMEKDLFLDVCCFFISKGKAYATKILNGCGVDADSGIGVLIERNLIKVKKNNKFGMHPFLREMGVTISRELSLKEPGKNKRLWFAKDKKYGTQDMQWLPDQAAAAVNSEYLSQKLRWMSLHGFYSEYLQNKFCVHDAIAIDLKHNSLLRLVWKESQVWRSLKVLNLSHSKYLTTTPDFTGLPSLEELILKCCSRLHKVHQSIGCLYNLLLLNLKDCTSLNSLPTEVYELKSLRTLILSGCSKIDIMDKDIAQLESLITLIAENTTVKEVPFSIVSSKCIGYISLPGFERFSHHNLFPSIIRSWMPPTMNPISYMHSFCMDMDGNSWDDIAPLLNTLRNLRSVLVQCDTEFQLSKQVKDILVEYFANITESGTSKHHVRSSWIGVGRYNEFFNTISYSISKVLASNESCDVSLLTVNDPYWLAHTGEGHSVSFTVPHYRDMKGMVLCVVYLSTPKIIEPEFNTILIVNYTKCTCHIHNHGTVISFNDEDWHDIMSNLEYGDKVEIFVNFGNGLVVKKTSVYLICGKIKEHGKSV